MLRLRTAAKKKEMETCEVRGRNPERDTKIHRKNRKRKRSQKSNKTEVEGEKKTTIH
jgi:hypothetical protein